MSTPLMRQYNEIKQRHPDCILFFRMGDFYELFGDDAVVAARILGITLTKRNHGKEGDMPLCGFPWHAAERYVPKMVSHGYKIAICEQLEDPKLAKGIVKRGVIEIVTSGTALSESNLEAKANNFLVCLHPALEGWQLACLDVSTGDFSLTLADLETAECELHRLAPSEVLWAVPPGMSPAETTRSELDLPEFLIHFLDSERATLSLIGEQHFDVIQAHQYLQERVRFQGEEAWGAAGKGAAAAVLHYAEDSKRRRLEHIEFLQLRRLGEFMLLDPQTLRNLELIKPLNHEDSDATLLAVLDHTSTSMGGRLLRQWLTHPLLQQKAIEERLDAVEELSRDMLLQDSLRRTLSQINDIERICGKVGAGRAFPRDLQGLGRSLERIAELALEVEKLHAPLLRSCDPRVGDLEKRAQYLAGSLLDDLPNTLREGRMIRSGHSAELDALNEGIREAREWLAGLEQRERERTGISSLKVGFNKVFGYYIEVTNTHRDKIPEDYIRKQTIANGERMITPEMKDYEALILHAESRINDLEYRLFGELRDLVHSWASDLQEISRRLSQLDCLLALAITARREAYVRPILSQEPILEVQGGFHPVIARKLERGTFITNDVHLAQDSHRLLLITGPNMAGKSTYLRQVALINLMAQVGSFVPAQKAVVGIADRIFTRVGASDRLSRGQSTFMVEMVETANILHHAGPRSLVLLDEIGRGTSTYDGLSLAWSILEYLHGEGTCPPRTLFATHYHEMTALADRLELAANCHISVKETQGRLIFLRKILPGACDSSYGIQVARMAGVPDRVVERAQMLLRDFEAEGIRLEKMTVRISDHKMHIEGTARVAPESLKNKKPHDPVQVDLFSMGGPTLEETQVLKALRSICVDETRPLEALNQLAQWQAQLSGQGDSQ
jgi:DNA mismatch repair protein MutS